MKNLRWVLFLFLYLSRLFSEPQKIGATYELSSGRFGDCLLSYLHAKWFAYKNNLPLYYKPFHYSSELVLDEREPLFSSLSVENVFQYDLADGTNPPESVLPVLFHCPYAPEDPIELKYLKHFNGQPWFRYNVDWEDKEFRRIVKGLIAPKTPLKLALPPRNTISIALHIREGGGYDAKCDLRKGASSHILKFPPIRFYVEGLLEIVKLFPDKKLYCQVFTDAKRPSYLVELIKEQLPPKTPISFSFRKQKNRHNLNVLEDFFSFFHYDILICSQSNFSLVTSFIHDYAAVYTPEDYEILPEGNVHITQVKLKKNQDYVDRLVNLPTAKRFWEFFNRNS